MISIEPIDADRLQLRPLRADDADDLVAIFSDPSVGRYIGGAMRNDVLRRRFERMPAGSPTPDEVWLSWTVRLESATIGLVQATVEQTGVDLAWVIGPTWQNRGFATEAMTALCRWLDERDAGPHAAHIHPDNAASIAVATKLGLVDSGRVDEDGERIYIAST